MIFVKLPSSPVAMSPESPLLVCFYGGGFDAKQGRGMLRKFLETAKKAGLADQLVLDHPSELKMPPRQPSSYKEYAARLVSEVNAVDSQRELIIVAYSLGVRAAYALACQLPSRLRAAFFVACRPPTQPNLEALGVRSRAELSGLGDRELGAAVELEYPRRALDAAAALRQPERHLARVRAVGGRERDRAVRAVEQLARLHDLLARDGCGEGGFRLLRAR